MESKIFISSLVWSFLILLPFCYKWRIRIKIGLVSSLIIGTLTGLLVSLINSYFIALHFSMLFFSELFFIVLLAIFAIIIRFYRDPERISPKERKVILSPADGKIRYVKKVENKEIPFSIKGKQRQKLTELTKTELLNDGAYLIGIEMSVLDIHVNRAPVAGKILMQKPTKGRFLSLKKIESLFCNERVTTIIDNGHFKIGVVQIASRLVKRIVSYLNEGDSVQIGQRIGMIKFGSQVDLVIPELENIKINSKPGEKVLAGVSVMAEYS